MKIEVIGHQSKKFGVLFMLTLIVFILTCCRNAKNEIACENIKKIKIAYLPKAVTTMIPIEECEGVLNFEITKDTTVFENNFICKLTNKLNKLEPSDISVNYNFRIYCLIFFNDNTPNITLCLGTNRVTVMNGKLMKDDKDLFELFDNLLYKDSVDYFN